MSTTTEPAYTVDYFLAKFEAIPEEKWCTGVYADRMGRSCAIGHCRDRYGSATPESDALLDTLRQFDPAAINDGGDIRYPQPTPRARILAALRDIKSSQTTNTKEA